jgi:hypothetical protein
MLIGLMPALLGMFAAQTAPVGQSVTRLIVQDEVIWRVPVQPRPKMRKIEWIARKGPRCVPVGAIRNALQSRSGQVDFVLGNRSRVRADFEDDCPALDFYGGFYLQPEDNRICAGRDAVHSRMGGSCMITRFRHLVPVAKRQIP